MSDPRERHRPKLEVVHREDMDPAVALEAMAQYLVGVYLDRLAEKEQDDAAA